MVHDHRVAELKTINVQALRVEMNIDDLLELSVAAYAANVFIYPWPLVRFLPVL